MDHGQDNIRDYDECRRGVAVRTRQVCFIVFIKGMAMNRVSRKYFDMR